MRQEQAMDQDMIILVVRTKNILLMAVHKWRAPIYKLKITEKHSKYDKYYYFCNDRSKDTHSDFRALQECKKRENQKEYEAGMMLPIIEYDSIERNRWEPIRENKANNFEGFSIFPFSSVCFKLRNLSRRRKDDQL